MRPVACLNKCAQYRVHTLTNTERWRVLLKLIKILYQYTRVQSGVCRAQFGTVEIILSVSIYMFHALAESSIRIEIAA